MLPNGVLVRCALMRACTLFACLWAAPATSNAMDVDVKAQETAHACEALSHRYFVALDAGDAAAFGALFAEDAVLTVPSATLRGRSEIEAYVAARPSDRRLRHHMTTHVINRVEGGSAAGAVYVLIAAEQDAGDGADVSRGLISGVYEDAYALNNGACRFRSRKLNVDFISPLPIED